VELNIEVESIDEPYPGLAGYLASINPQPKPALVKAAA
jgi:hypothetical protein